MNEPVAPLQLSVDKFAGGSFLTDPEGLVTDLNRVISALFLESVGDDRPPRVKWTGDGTVEVGASPGMPLTVRLTLQDYSQRSFVGPLGLSLASALDVGAEGADIWYYVYAVPDPTDDTKLVGKFSANPPSVGPVGFTNYAFLGAVRNDGSSNLVKLYQAGSKISYFSAQVVESLGPVDLVINPSPVAVSLADQVPASAGYALLRAKLKAQAGGTGVVSFFTDGGESDPALMTIQSNSTSFSYVGFGMPLPSSTKRLFRQVEEISGDLDVYELKVLGWIDDYLI